MAFRAFAPTVRRAAMLALPVIVAPAVNLSAVNGIAHADTGSTTDTVADDSGHLGSLLAEARRELGAARATHYQHTTDVDELTGRFDYDCSGFVDYALRRVAPAAYRALPVSRTRPLAEDFVTAMVADSTTSPHANDTRVGGSSNGLGTGTIGLVADDSGRPVAYYWRGGVSSELEHTTVALGRLS